MIKRNMASLDAQQASSYPTVADDRVLNSSEAHGPFAFSSVESHATSLSVFNPLKPDGLIDSGANCLDFTEKRFFRKLRFFAGTIIATTSKAFSISVGAACFQLEPTMPEV